MRGNLAITRRRQGAVSRTTSRWSRWGIESYLGVPLLRRARATTSATSRSSTSGRCRRSRGGCSSSRSSRRAPPRSWSGCGPSGTLRESEQRFRDLFEEAPIAYVHEDLDRASSAPTAPRMRILGLQARGSARHGRHVARARHARGAASASARPSPRSAGARTPAASCSSCAARTTAGRLDPVVVASPSPDGKYTRTMFVDITDRVLAEQEQARLQQQNLYLQEEIKSAHNFEEIVGRSPRCSAVLDKVEQVAPTDATVLITGETGTGKELIARAIHSASQRKDKPLIKLNCAALPTGLVESELFGHEKGAFTGAIARRIGRFELADGGTIFLDEIGDMPPEVQAKLLRVLQEREFEPRRRRRRRSRSTCASSPPPTATCCRPSRDRTFREDLYYRLNVFPIAAAAAARAHATTSRCWSTSSSTSSRRGSASASTASSPATLQRLAAYPWPGNVRELENVIERAVILAAGPRAGDRRRTSFAAPRRTPDVPTRRDHALDARRRRARAHPARRSARPAGSSTARAAPRDPRPAPQHPAQPDEEARHRPPARRSLVQRDRHCDRTAQHPGAAPPDAVGAPREVWEAAQHGWPSLTQGPSAPGPDASALALRIASMIAERASRVTRQRPGRGSGG